MEPFRSDEHQTVLDCVAGCATHVGKIRRINEDSFVCHPRLFVVADGMGGHSFGDIASQLAVRAFADFDGRSPHEMIAVVDAIREAHLAVHEASSTRGASGGMGTTLAGVAIVANGAGPDVLVFHVGDSRCYRLRADRIEQLTVDHSEVQEMVEAGVLSAEDARHHPHRNVVTRAVGIDDDAVPDLMLITDVVDDRFIICSDGVSGELTDDQIWEIASRHREPAAASDALIDAVLAGAASDNATVIVVDIRRNGSRSADSDITGPRPRVTGQAFPPPTPPMPADRSLVAVWEPPPLDGPHPEQPRVLDTSLPAPAGTPAVPDLIDEVPR